MPNLWKNANLKGGAHKAPMVSKTGPIDNILLSTTSTNWLMNGMNLLLIAFSLTKFHFSVIDDIELLNNGINQPIHCVII